MSRCIISTHATSREASRTAQNGQRDVPRVKAFVPQPDRAAPSYSSAFTDGLGTSTPQVEQLDATKAKLAYASANKARTTNAILMSSEY